jgi:hypothetical protein
MTQLTIVTTPTNSGDGTPLATAFNYCNNNFNELYARFQVDPPGSLIGTTGDVPGMYAVDSTYFYYCFDTYDGTSTIWGQVTQVGNISVSSISSGTSNVKISDVNGNATTSITGVSNVVVVAATGQYVTGLVSATGNIRGSYILGNGSQLTGLPATYTNANVVNLLSTFGSNVISTTGNVTGGNLLTNNIISATGNITTSGFFIGDFVGNITGTITNIPGPGGAVLYNNGTGNVAATAGLIFDDSGPNVLTVQGSYSATDGITATGNITGGNLSGTNIAGTLTTAAQNNVTSVGTLSSLTVTANVAGGNLTTGGQVSATGNIRTANYLSVGQDINVSGDVTATSYTGSNLSLSGNIIGGNLSTAGNITGNYILGNISFANGLPPTNTIQNGNSNVLVGAVAGNVSINVNGISPLVIFTPLGQTTTGIISATGTVTAGNVATGGTVSATGEVTGANLRTNGTVSASGNIIGENISTAGNILVSTNRGIVSSNVSITLDAVGQVVINPGYMTSTGDLDFYTASFNNYSELWLHDEGNAVISTAGNAHSWTFDTTGNLTAPGAITVGNIVNANGNGVGNIGSSSRYFNTVFATATSAQYADLAENYVADADYAPGTVVIFGGEQEITVTTDAADERVAGVISTNPAYLMNSREPGLPVALRGKVPVRVVGPVVKGDSLVTSTTPGVAFSVGRERAYGQAVFAKSLESNNSDGEKVILAVIV